METGGDSLMTGNTQTLPAPFKSAQWMSRGMKGCAPERVHLDGISGCRKEKVTGLTQGRLCLASLFAFWWGRGGAVIVFQLEISKAFNIIPHNLCPG